MGEEVIPPHIYICISPEIFVILHSMNFSDTELNEYVLEAVETMGFQTLTPIQEASIPPLLEGRDLIGVAQTGTGKTAAFLLPVLNELSYGDYPSDKINCLIMAPTRELAKQIDEQLQGFSYYVPVSSSAVYGGNDGPEFARQRQGLKMGADIIVATPGRLISHISMGYVDLSEVSFFILDEADRMLDMGFYDDIKQIASYLPDYRQTIMFSATMPDKIQKLAKSILNNPVRVEIAVSKPAENIRQEAIYVHETQKLNAVKEIFAKEKEVARSLIFASSKLKVKELARTLRQKGYKVAEMHSDLDQAQRDEVMHSFKNGSVKMLVATDIVARGIDIDDIALVMNYDVPREAEDYVHRIGRTARAGASGRAITLVNGKDLTPFRKIEKFLGKEIPPLKLQCSSEEELNQPLKKTGHRSSASKQRNTVQRGYGRKKRSSASYPSDKRADSVTKKPTRNNADSLVVSETVQSTVDPKHKNAIQKDVSIQKADMETKKRHYRHRTRRKPSQNQTTQQ